MTRLVWRRPTGKASTEAQASRRNITRDIESHLSANEHQTKEVQNLGRNETEKTRSQFLSFRTHVGVVDQQDAAQADQGSAGDNGRQPPGHPRSAEQGDGEGS